MTTFKSQKTYISQNYASHANRLVRAKDVAAWLRPKNYIAALNNEAIEEARATQARWPDAVIYYTRLHPTKGPRSERFTPVIAQKALASLIATIPNPPHLRAHRAVRPINKSRENARRMGQMMRAAARDAWRKHQAELDRIATLSDGERSAAAMQEAGYAA